MAVQFVLAAVMTPGLPAAERPLVDSGSNPAACRWLDVADQACSPENQAGYGYGGALVEVFSEPVGPTFSGTLSATCLEPNFTYQLKLDGDSGTPANERTGFAGPTGVPVTPIWPRQALFKQAGTPRSRPWDH